MKYSVAQLKKDAKAGILTVQMTMRGGKPVTDDSLPDMCKGKRKVVGCNTVDLFIQTHDGKKSTMQIPKATLLEYTDDSLTVYYPGYREPTDEEKRILEEWDKIASTDKYKEQSYNDAMTDGSSTYWQEKRFFKDRNAEYLMGLNRERGMMLIMNKRYNGEAKYILDEKVRGDIELQYKVERN